MVYTTQKTLKKMSESIDSFGDSYTEAVSLTEVREVRKRIDIKEEKKKK